MLITFHSKVWSSITMFGDVAIRLLKMTGHSGTVPGALLAADVPAALGRLQQALATAGPDEEIAPGAQPGQEDADTSPPVGIHLRAYPLIQLLSASAEQGSDVMWEQGHPVI